MNEKILEIKKIEKYTYKKNHYDGFEIKTEEQSILLLIDSYSQCCERFGILTSEDNLDDFIGSNLFNVTITDKALKTKTVDMLKEFDNNCFNTVFINFDTNKGTLQFVAYNGSGSGFYGHDVILVSTRTTFKTTLY